MDKSLIEKYKSEMINMYRTAKPAFAEKRAVAVVAEPTSEAEPRPETATNSDSGGLIVAVTTVRSLYPLENATVTVFSGEYPEMQVIARDSTDQSGKTKEFVLSTPNKNLSLNSQNTLPPYATYGIEVKAEGYVDTVYLNVPVFSGVTSIQRVNMTLLETAGKDKGPYIFNESQQYNLTNSEG